MPHTYTGDPDAAIADPPTGTLPSDGDKRAVASVNPVFQFLLDGLAKFMHYGARTDQGNTFDNQNTFSDVVFFLRKANFSLNTTRANPAVLANVATQTINPNTQHTNLYMGILATNPPALGAAARIVYLDTAGVANGDWVRVNFNDTVGSGVWVFRRGGDNAHDLCILDNGLEDSPGGDVPNAAYDNSVTIEFQVIGGVWRVVEASLNVVKGTYA